MRLITRRDGSLVVALVVAAFVVFQQPLRWLLDLTHDVEDRYQLDLLPGLVVLFTVFFFHNYRKRLQARAEARTASAEAAQARARFEELERLMTFGRSLGNVLDHRAMQQVLWRYLPTFTHERETWIVHRGIDAWDVLLQDASRPPRAPDLLEALATKAIKDAGDHESASEGVPAGDEHVCFVMSVNAEPVGVLGIGNSPALNAGERKALGIAAALIGIAIRNMDLLQSTRDNALRDGLTGCVNHAHGLERLQGELLRARRTRRPLSILMFDLDHFKEVNDRFGHVRGDLLLAEVGAHLTRVLRASDVRCRYGGDEFLVILPDTPVLGAEQVAAGLRQEIAALRVGDGNGSDVGITASIGVAVAGAEEEVDAAALVERADEALYQAKKEGRDRFCVRAGGEVKPSSTPEVGPGLIR